jgi:hypothetical protein
MSTDRPTYQVTPRALRQTDAAGREIPAVVRLRRLLKFAKRWLRLEIVNHVELAADKQE